MSQAETGDARGTTPPYIAFQTFKTLLSDSKEHGVPGRIDKSVLTRFSGGVGSQLISALRFLGLIGRDNVPTEDYRLYVNAYGTDQWAPDLATLLESKYGPIMAIDLQSATPSQFNNIFKASYPATDETQRKCMTFFLNAAREAGLPISPYILKGTKPRASNGRSAPRKPKTSSAQKSGNPASPPPPPPPPPPPAGAGAAQTPEQMLVEMLSADMDADEQQAVFKLLVYLRTKKNGGAG